MGARTMGTGASLGGLPRGHREVPTAGADLWEQLQGVRGLEKFPEALGAALAVSDLEGQLARLLG